MPARPGREQRGFAKACRSAEQRQRGGKRPIEGREQALALHQCVWQARRSEPAGEQQHPLVEYLRGLLLGKERPGCLLQMSQREVLHPSEIALAGAALAGMVGIPIRSPAWPPLQIDIERAAFAVEGKGGCGA